MGRKLAADAQTATTQTVRMVTAQGVRTAAALAALAATALATAACARHTTAAPMAGNLGPPETAPVTTTPAAPVSTLPPCGDIASAATPPDCYLQSRDPAGLTFEVRHSGSGEQTSVSITVLDPTGAPVQAIAERAVGAAEPRLRDLDDDGRDELIIPIMLASANTRYIVYRATGDAVHLQRAGELAGIGLDTSAAGYTVVTARESYELWKIEFWTFDADRLQPLVTAQVQFLDDGTGHIGGSQCTVTDSGGLSRTGLNLDQATAQFCAEPTVLRVRR
ncbi:hypothetical protein [Nocardia seriolae]|uniref:Uncharacterized protein n=1 Tax=Nocardia seriolae TaxID=37332 RepID=A0ABC8AS51_9NOCA|nr:hypothetical protein [Nocardia seriolae]APA97041.1 hypothetical protein NS506_02983 [Nocardia seriolae]MTJ86918.1 hypothetical protein [Nocardia seriolae]MTK30913.1 hypothetical protein [Nocardia seriolae]MTK43112.1 hypothetical protein [Nocardia seriolae]OJF81887.1 hypothetical protein NS14008_25345 [Nocardia seriolae]